MKKSDGRQKGKKIRIIKRPVIFLLAAALIAVPGIRVLADVVDTTKQVSLTVNASGDAELQTDLATANVVIDLYKVADLNAQSGSEGYIFETAQAFDALSEDINKKDNDSTAWQTLADAAAGIVFDTASGNTVPDPVVTGMGAGNRIQQTDAGANLSAGLYLVIARGSNAADYVKTVENAAGKKTAVTIAVSEEYIYSFAPELVALPGKDPDANGNVYTANEGDWNYDVEIDLKPQRENKTASLEIVKSLDAYETKDPATFVFSVEAAQGGSTVYSDVVAMTFTAPGQKSTLVEGIPVGAEVVVTEIYSGASYKLTSAESQTVTISADGVAQVAFSNTYDDTFHGGGSVQNRFYRTYNEETGTQNWQLDPVVTN